MPSKRAARAARTAPAAQRVEMRHPSGRYTVTVSPARAITLRGRGWRELEAEPKPPRRSSTKSTAEE